jgi:flagellar hook protein FlgE
MDPISIARYGMMAATQQLTGSATRIAGAGAGMGASGGGDVDYATEAVTQIQASTAFKADVGVIKVADEMWQSLLNLQSAPQHS